MGSTRLLWRAAGLSGLLTSLLFLFGFGYAVQDLLHPKGPTVTQAPSAGPVEASGKDKLSIVALGDSLTRGVGDETGEGYVGKVKKRLEAYTKKPVYVSNNGRNGYKTDQLLSFMQEPTIMDLVKGADIVLLTIGGNDLNQFGTGGSPVSAAGQDQPDVEINYSEAAKRMPEAAGRLETILTKLHDANPKAQIIYVGLYHPYMELDPKGEGAKLLQEWNSRAFAVASRYKNMFVVPTYDLFQNDGARFLYVDHFHPNAAGYDRIAERVFQVLQ